MKRLLVLMLAAVFLFSGAAFAAEPVKDKRGEDVKAKGSGTDVQTKGTKEGAPKAVKMKTTGTVMAISDGAMKLEKAGKDMKETMEFYLVKAYPEIKAGDKVNVTYTKKDGKNVAEKVSKVKEKSAKPPAAKKSAEPGPPVKDKRGQDVKSKSGGEVDTKKK